MNELGKELIAWLDSFRAGPDSSAFVDDTSRTRVAYAGPTTRTRQKLAQFICAVEEGPAMTCVIFRAADGSGFGWECRTRRFAITSQSFWRTVEGAKDAAEQARKYFGLTWTVRVEPRSKFETRSQTWP